MKFTIEMPEESPKFTVEMPQQEKSIPALVGNKLSQLPAGIARQTARTGSRIAETLGSLPRTALDIGESVYGMMPNLISESTQKEIYPALQEAYQTGKSFVPSAEDIRSGIGKLAPENYLEPQNQAEELADNFVSDLVSLAVPIGPLGGVAKGTAVAASALGNLGSFAAKKLGVGEKGQSVIKMGLMLGTTLGGSLSLKKKAQDWYKTSKEAIKPNERMTAAPLKPLMKEIEKDYLQGGFSGTDKKVIDVVMSELQDSIDPRTNSIDLNELWKFKREMPGRIVAAGGPRTIPGQYLSRLSKDMNEALKKHSPNKLFSDALTAADQLYTGSIQAQNINNSAMDIIGKNKTLQAGIAHAFLGNPKETIKNAAKGFGLGALYASGAHTLNAIKNIFSNPAVNREYMAIMNAAAKNNAPVVIKHAKKFDIQLNKFLRHMLEDETDKIQRR